MNIINLNLKFTGLRAVAKSEKKFIVTHHPAAKVYSPLQIHNQHLNQGWGGAGYHFYIRKDGSVYELRPTLTWGAHCNTHNKNRDGIGVCWEGNYDMESTMPKEQFEAGVELYRYLMKEYSIPLKNISRHRDWKPTGCPGKNFPWQALIESLKQETKTMTLIAGSCDITKEQVYKHINAVNHNCRLTVKLSELIGYYFEACKKYNIRTDIAISQALLETAYFRYGSIVHYKQNNFAGIGALDGNARGVAAVFASAREGVYAHVQHLLAYASVAPITDIVDPRFHLVQRGSAPYLEYLSIPNNPNGYGWASDPDYANKIRSIMTKIRAVEVEREHWATPSIYGMIEEKVISEYHDPSDRVTWGELATVVMKLIEKRNNGGKL